MPNTGRQRAASGPWRYLCQGALFWACLADKGRPDVRSQGRSRVRPELSPPGSHSDNGSDATCVNDLGGCEPVCLRSARTARDPRSQLYSQ